MQFHMLGLQQLVVVSDCVDNIDPLMQKLNHRVIIVNC